MKELKGLFYVTEAGRPIGINLNDNSAESYLLRLAVISLIKSRKDKFLGTLFVKKAIEKNEITQFLTHKEKLILDSIAQDISNKTINTSNTKSELNMDTIVINRIQLAKENAKPSMFKKLREVLKNSYQKARTNSKDPSHSISEGDKTLRTNSKSSSRSIF